MLRLAMPTTQETQEAPIKEGDIRQEANAHLANIKRMERRDLIASNGELFSECAHFLARRADLAELLTRKVLRLTWGLLIFTVALFVVTLALLAVEVRLMLVPQNAYANTNHIQLGQQQEQRGTNQEPPAPNR